MKPHNNIAPFPRYSKQNSQYFVEFVNSLGQKYDEKLRGLDLPIASRILELNNSPLEAKRNYLDNTKIITDLPVAFFETFLKIQGGVNPINTFPLIGQNKNITVRKCLEHNEHFLKGDLSLENWQKLGWKSIDQYNAWLDTLMLFAFSHCHHYCSATRIFDADIDRMNDNPNQLFRFKQQGEGGNFRKTNIYSVTGYEFRNIQLAPPKEGDRLCYEVGQHTIKTIQQMLAVAEKTNTTDIVLIPFGTGVFVPPQFTIIKRFLFAGINRGLLNYKGPELKIHWCGPRGVLEQNNALIKIVEHIGEDAYTIANAIQDQGDIEHNTTEDGRQLKSMLINAGDNDWTALLSPRKTPGQMYRGHTLFDETSDEYLALVTEFPFHSIQNMIQNFPNLVEEGKLEQIDLPFEPQEFHIPKSIDSFNARPKQATESSESVKVSMYNIREGLLALSFPDTGTRDRFAEQLQSEPLTKFQIEGLRKKDRLHENCPIQESHRSRALFIPARIVKDPLTQQARLMIIFSSILQAERFMTLLQLPEKVPGIEMPTNDHQLSYGADIYLPPGLLVNQDGSILTVDFNLKQKLNSQHHSSPTGYGGMFRTQLVSDTHIPRDAVGAAQTPK